MNITSDFCGGNIRVGSIEGDLVRLEVELRDTRDDWFYWAFRVSGAAGRTLHFDFSPKAWVGYFGAAVSRDLEHWSWLCEVDDGWQGFSYSFAEDEDEVYFAHDLLYHPSRFYKFAESHGLSPRILAVDRGGTPIPCVTVGQGSRTLLLTARHHCCEATGNYIMEGIIDEYLKNPLPELKIFAIPFMDADGVVAGDQGKNRAPHDHNRDYVEYIYPSTRAVRELLEGGEVFAAFDLHSPWHFGGRNDKLFIVRKDFENLEKYKLFGKCLEKAITPEALKYDSANDIDPNVEWNRADNPCTCAAACHTYPSVELAFTLETTYFGEVGNVVTREKLVETGRCFYRAFCAYLEKRNLL